MSRTGHILPVEITDLGGLNLQDERHLIGDNEAYELKNFDIIGNRLKKRPGIARQSTTAAFNTKSPKICAYNRHFGHLLINVHNSSFADDIVLRSSDGGVTWTECKTAAAASMNFFCPKAITYYTATYFPTKADGLWAWDGINMVNTLPGNHGFLVDILQDRLFVFNPTTQLIYYTEPAAFASFPAANFFGVGIPFEGDPIVGGVSYKDRMVIFKKNSVWILYPTGTPVNWQLKRFVEGIGATSIYSFKVIDDYIYFISQKGIYRTNLSTIEELSSPFRDLFKTRASLISSTDAWYDAVNYGDCIGQLDNRIFFNCNMATARTFNTRRHRMFVWYTDEEKWSEWVPNIASGQSDNYLAPMNMEFIPSTSTSGAQNAFTQGLYYGSSEYDGKFFMLSDANTLLDDASNYSCSFKSKTFDFDASSELKKIPYCFAEFKASAQIKLDIVHTVNEVAQAAHSYNAGTFAGTFKRLKFPGPGYVRTISTDYTFSVPSGTDSSGVELTKFGYNLRIPRPVGSDTLV